MEDLVRFRRRRAVGAFDDQLRLDVVDVLLGDLLLERGGNEDVDVELEDVLSGERLAAREPGDGLVLRGCSQSASECRGPCRCGRRLSSR